MVQVSARYSSLALSRRGFTYDTLLHGKALLVIAAGDADNLYTRVSMHLRLNLFRPSYVALPFITKRVGRNFVAHALFHENTQLSVIVDFDHLLRPIGRVGDVELHLGAGCDVYCQDKCESRQNTALDLEDVKLVGALKIVDPKSDCGKFLATRTAKIRLTLALPFTFYLQPHHHQVSMSAYIARYQDLSTSTR